MKDLQQKLLSNPYPLLIVFIVAVIFVTNYIPGTYLAGWDNLQTELNPVLALKRSVFSVWQEYQSFGLTSGMAHSTDLVRSLFILLLSLIFDVSFVRYFFHILMYLLGGLGVYYLLVDVSFGNDKKGFAFLGSLFYLLNLGTIQIFSVPFESFSIFFGFLPWEVLIFLRFIKAEYVSKQQVLIFLLVNFLATSQAYLQTLFIVYLISLGCLFLGHFYLTPTVKLFKRWLFAFCLILLVNLFWILPQLYFVSTSLSVVKDAKINQLATDIVSRQNANKGYLKNFTRLEGFYVDLADSTGDKIFEPWITYLENPFVNVLSYLPFVLLVIGLFRKSPVNLGFGFVLLIAGIFLLRNVAPFSYLSTLLLRDSFVGQIFRSPFTKFVGLYSLAFSYFFASGLDILYTKLVKSKSSEDTLELQVYIFVFATVLFLLSIPALKGNLFASIMRVNIPDPYFEVMDYFKSKDKSKRIAMLPDYTFWYWFKYKWGYDGSGFIWYGIEQPIVSRTFDVWSLKSESYFWEIKSAIESVDVIAFEKVLEKYNIDYLVLDYNLLPISSVEEGLQYDQTERLLKGSQKVILEQRFQNVLVYKVNHPQKVESFVSVTKNIPSAKPKIEITNKDTAFSQLGFYMDSNRPDYIYPFLDLTTQTDLKNAAWEIIEDGDSFIFKSQIEGVALEDYTLARNDISLESKVFLGEEVKDVKNEVEQYIDGDSLIVKVKKSSVLKFDPSFVSVNQCRTPGTISVTKRGISLEVTSKGGAMACFGYEEKLLAHWNGYLVRVDSENVSGNPLFFYIVGNIARRQSKLEVDLNGGVEYFVLNPGWYFDDGYYFSFQNRSYEYVDTTNVLKAFDIYLLPVEYIKNIKLIRKDLAVGGVFGGSGEGNAKQIPASKAEFLSDFKVNKKHYYLYKINDMGGTDINVILYQAFDKGWQAYKVEKGNWIANIKPFWLGEGLNEHFEVNNWANGWKVDDIGKNEALVLIFWPQYLEYMGLFVLFVIPLAILLATKRR